MRKTTLIKGLVTSSLLFSLLMPTALAERPEAPGSSGKTSPLYEEEVIYTSNTGPLTFIWDPYWIEERGGCYNPVGIINPAGKTYWEVSNPVGPHQDNVLGDEIASTIWGRVQSVSLERSPVNGAFQGEEIVFCWD